jgi:hypothetical protein
MLSGKRLLKSVTDIFSRKKYNPEITLVNIDDIDFNILNNKITLITGNSDKVKKNKAAMIQYLIYLQYGYILSIKDWNSKEVKNEIDILCQVGDNKWIMDGEMFNDKNSIGNILKKNDVFEITVKYKENNINTSSTLVIGRNFKSNVLNNVLFDYNRLVIVLCCFEFYIEDPVFFNYGFDKYALIIYYMFLNGLIDNDNNIKNFILKMQKDILSFKQEKKDQIYDEMKMMFIKNTS